MLDPTLRTVLLIAGGLVFLLSFVWLGMDWGKVRRVSHRALTAFYMGTLLVLVGLQPLRPFRVEVAGAVMLPSEPEVRAVRLEKIREEGWIIAAAKPESLVEREHPAYPHIRAEVEGRFQDHVESLPAAMDRDAPDFLFVGRKISGWSRNPETTLFAFVFLGVVMVLSGLRHLIAYGARTKSAE